MDVEKHKFLKKKCFLASTKITANKFDCDGESHKDIMKLHCSVECRKFFEANNDAEGAATNTNNNFVKKVIGAVSPLIPLTLRNKALDGSYLRSALHLLGASEFHFTQYEEDVRVNANPAGVVVMSYYLHAELYASHSLW